MGEMTNAHKILVGNPEDMGGMREYENVMGMGAKTGVQDTWWEGGDWIDLARDRINNKPWGVF